MRGSLRTRIALVTGTLAALAAAAGAALGATVTDTALLVAGVTVVALLAVGLARIAASPLAAPIERLAARAATFAAGGRELGEDVVAREAAHARGPRETRIIGESFEAMALRVSTAIDELHAEERRKSRFVSDVSHELRTPLTAIRGAAETLLDGGVPAEDRDRFLSTIVAESDRLARLANDLLTLQRIEGATGELPLRRVNLADVVSRAAAALEPLLEDRGVTLATGGSAPVVLGDMDRLQQVVSNLIDNASRIVGEDGHVWVELGAEGDHALLAVSDDGPGVDEDELPRLFDRFYRSDSSRTRTSGGAGLGLAIVKAIVTAHGGTIAATPRDGGGSRFEVRLPALDGGDGA